MIRIVFSKSSFATYISHLDMTRCMSRLFSRAEVPIWFTQGFNPHPYMVFSAALPIGITGENEFLDIKLTEECDFEELCARMNAEAPRGLEFKKIYTADNSFSEIVSALYTLELPESYVSSFAEFLERDEINISKKTKKGFIEVNLKDHIKYEMDGNTFKVILPCGNDMNLSPLLLTKAYLDEYTEHDNDFNITRHCFYKANGEKFE